MTTDPTPELTDHPIWGQFTPEDYHRVATDPRSAPGHRNAALHMHRAGIDGHEQHYLVHRNSIRMAFLTGERWSDCVQSCIRAAQRDGLLPTP